MSAILNYNLFLSKKRSTPEMFGFEPNIIPDYAFDFQRHLIEWACRKGRSAIFADCGLGKTLMQLVWAENVAAETGGRVLILTPLAVSHQTVNESAKFGIHAVRSNAGELPSQIVVTNYERLHYFKPEDFAGVVCDESSILKNFAGSTREAITEFMAKVNYRMLCTATAAPNDFMELGTSSEALGYLKYREMLSMFFSHDGGETSKWTLKGHAAKGPFWQWLCSWARAIRNPGDLGFCARGFDLPELKIRRHIVSTNKAPDGFLFNMPAVGLDEQRDERRRTINERCEMAASLISSHKQSAVAWCHLNAEGDLLQKMIPGAVQVSGSDSDDRKEEVFRAFESGDIRVIVTKPTIAGFGLNWQHCHHQTFFPSHSFEQWYQAIRRCWRFGQKNPVTVDVISSDGEADVVANLERKAAAADRLFEQIVRHMNEQISHSTKQTTTNKIQIPSWL
jgi:hypothetical protein